MMRTSISDATARLWWDRLNAWFVVLVAVLVIGGWLVNIARLVFECDHVAPYTCETIRAAGVALPPVGVMAAFVDLEQ